MLGNGIRVEVLEVAGSGDRDVLLYSLPSPASTSAPPLQGL
jgi:hypothetical protein